MMQIVSGNFYVIQLLDNPVVSIRLEKDDLSRDIPVGEVANLFVGEEFLGGRLVLTTTSAAFEYGVIADANELQQIYTLRFQDGGLTSNVDTIVEIENDLSTSDEIPFLTSSRFYDYNLWFQTQELRIAVPNEEIVDSVHTMLPVSHPAIDVSALQSSEQLVLLISPDVTRNVTSEINIRFRIVTNGGEYVTQPMSILPGDPALSDCQVSGTLFESVASTVTSLKNRTNSITFTLRFETWIDDLSALRQGILELLLPEAFYVAGNEWFSLLRPELQNPRGLGVLLEEASVVRASEQVVIVTLGQNATILHPERLNMRTKLSPSLLRSGQEGVPLQVPFVKTILPAVPALEVITENGDVLSEKDFWTRDARVTLHASSDLWQDMASLTPGAVQSFYEHIRNSLTSPTSPEWREFISSATFALFTEGPNLHIDFAKISSSEFNISSAIEVIVDVPLTTADGFPTRIGGQEFPSPTHFVVNPVVAFVSVSRSVVTEQELWNGDTQITFVLIDDELVGDEQSILRDIKESFDAAFPGHSVQLGVTVATATAFELVIANASPSSFNISTRVQMEFEFSATLFRNGNSLRSPPVTFEATDVRFLVDGLSPTTKQDVASGFSFTVELVNDVWLPSAAVSPLETCSRQKHSSGWEATIDSLLSYEFSESTISVTIPPNNAYDISTVETVDIFVREGATRNNKRLFLHSLSIQGSDQVERDHHAYVVETQQVRDSCRNLRRFVHDVKRSVRYSSPNVNNGHFLKEDSVYDRHRKLNSKDLVPTLAVCRPPLLQGVASFQIHTSIVDIRDTIFPAFMNPYIPKLELQRLSVPVLHPALSSTTRKLYSVILSRPAVLEYRVNSLAEVTTTAREASVHLIWLDAVETVEFSGAGLRTTVYTAAATG